MKDHPGNDAFVWFLDCDGVVCTSRAHMVTRSFDDPIAFGLLKRIVDRTDSVIVVSSTRRGNADMGMPNNVHDMLRRYGLIDRLHPDWRTGNMNSRSAEIADWLDRNGMRPYGILDDERNDFTPDQLQRLIHTDMNFGISPQDTGRAIRLAATPLGSAPARDSDDDAYQTPRITIGSLARTALAAMEQGDDAAVRHLLDIIADHPLAQ